MATATLDFYATCGHLYLVGANKINMAALPQRVNTGYLIMHYLMFAVLGLAFSLILNCYYKSSSEEILKNAIQAPQLEYPLSEVKRIVERTDCEKFKAEAHLPESIADFLSTKLRYQFEPDITDESSMLDCRAVKVKGGSQFL